MIFTSIQRVFHLKQEGLLVVMALIRVNMLMESGTLLEVC